MTQKKSIPDQGKRDLLKAAAVASVGSLIGACSGGSSSDSASTSSSNQAPQDNASNSIPKNILVILTDQERNHLHWPANWVSTNLPSFARLQKNGLTFSNAYTSACECAPSRAVMMTGQFSNVNKVGITFPPPGLPTQNQLPSLGAILAQQSKHTPVWKGKWHLSYPVNAPNSDASSAWSTADIAYMQTNYGWTRWNPPDAGTVIPRAGTLAANGGGLANNDGRFISGITSGAQTPNVVGAQSALDFLNNEATTLGQPFCLFVSLVNPHDIGAYPAAWQASGYDLSSFQNMGITLPPNYIDSLTQKPAIQTAYANSCRSAFTLVNNAISNVDALNYVNFYAYLHTAVDQQITTLLDTLDKLGLTEDTIIIRTADHGEHGLSHGMTEKSYTAYEEVINIPLVISNPKLFPTAQTTDAFYDHQDFLPTILDLAGVADPNSYGNGVGKSIVPVIQNPKTATGRDFALFTYDDVFGLPSTENYSHIRAIRQGSWMYAVYFTPNTSTPQFQYELYDLNLDPYQLTNLLANTANIGAATRSNWYELHSLLTQNFTTANQLPTAFAWPSTPS